MKAMTVYLRRIELDLAPLLSMKEWLMTMHLHAKRDGTNKRVGEVYGNQL
jgi:hypothetical protein